MYDQTKRRTGLNVCLKRTIKNVKNDKFTELGKERVYSEPKEGLNE
jgi:hypothetical protein